MVRGIIDLCPLSWFIGCSSVFQNHHIGLNCLNFKACIV